MTDKLGPYILMRVLSDKAFTIKETFLFFLKGQLPGENYCEAMNFV